MTAPQATTAALHALRGSVWVVLVGVLFLLDSFDIVSLDHSWPLFIIVAGLMAIFESRLLPASRPRLSLPAAPSLLRRPLPPPPSSPPTSTIRKGATPWQTIRHHRNIPPGPPYGGDWKYQRRVIKEQARAQRDMLQRPARCLPLPDPRHAPQLHPGSVPAHLARSSSSCSCRPAISQVSISGSGTAACGPLLLVGAGIIMLLEWAFDQYIQSDPTQPRYRRRIGGGVFTLLLIFVITGIFFSGVREGGHSRFFDGHEHQPGQLDEFMGDKHESDQTLTQDSPSATPSPSTTRAATSPSPAPATTTRSTSPSTNRSTPAPTPKPTTRPSSSVPPSHQRQHPHTSKSPRSKAPVPTSPSPSHLPPPPPSPPTTATSTSAPLKAAVIVTANHGDITLSAITGPVAAHINNGDSSFSAHSVTGPIALEGQGRDTTLSDLTGPVTISGDFFGTTHFEHIRGAIDFHTSRTDFQLARLDGEIEIGPAPTSPSARLSALSPSPPAIATSPSIASPAISPSPTATARSTSPARLRSATSPFRTVTAPSTSPYPSRPASPSTPTPPTATSKRLLHPHRGQRHPQKLLRNSRQGRPHAPHHAPARATSHSKKQA